MCGLVGFVGSGPSDSDAVDHVAAMNAQIVHRGPDAEGTWVDAQAGVALGHRRLAIIDLSESGAQPMHSADGRYVIVYNGEIYNFRQLRCELDAAGCGPAWRGHSDTEVLLAAIMAWGVIEALKRAKGMFAFALWDRKDRTIAFARDRMGEKPLYFGWQGVGASRVLLFGSDLAALRAHPAFEGDLDREAIEDLVRYLYIPEPRSIYCGISKLRPGTLLTIDPATGNSKSIVYWDTIDEARTARRSAFRGSPQEAVDELETLLTSAVIGQMGSDVPLGAFLSGGIDSSTIVALMQAQSTRPVKTFTIGFGESDYDEAVHARAVAAHFGTDHTELILQPSDALSVIPELPEIYSEPFADSSQIPTYLLSKLARSRVTVSLSGDAGDELFGGYNRHVYADRRWPVLRRVPRPIRQFAGQTIMSLPPWVLDRASHGTGFVRDKLHKAASALSSSSDEELYARIVAINPDASRLVEGGREGGRDKLDRRVANWSPAEKFMALDTVGYLPGDILAKVDRASMAASLESRIPMLDPDVVRFAWSLPIGFKIRGGVSKWPLRQLLYRHAPRALVDRPKRGFAIPVDEWLRGPLRDWAEALLDPDRVRESAIFASVEVQKLWLQHLSNRQNNGHRLWPILMTNAWLEAQRKDCLTAPRQLEASR